jgi:protease IV
MANDAETLVERQKLRRRLLFWRILFVVALIVVGILAFGRVKGEASGAYVALLDVTGVIESDRVRDEAIENVAQDGNATALVLRINSPGGTFVGGEALFIALQRVAEKKPVVVVMDDVAASAGYMIAMAGEHIIARRGTITGSIGVIFPTTDVVDFFDNLGITFENIKSDPLKANPSPFERTLPQARAWAQIVVDDMQKVFVGIVDDGRPNLDRTAIEILADGRIYTGTQALENGLIDELGGEREARAWLLAQHDISEDLPVRNVEVEEELPWYLEMVRETGKSVLPEPLTLDGLLALWQPDFN